MSQSRFSIVLVGVSALLRRPLVSRLRPAEGERSSWVVFTARGGRFESGFRSVGWFFRSASWHFLFRFGDGRSASWASGSLLPLFGTHCFGDCRSAGWPSGSRLPLFGMHRFGVAVRRVDSSARWLAFGLTASAFRHAPIRRLPLGGLVFGFTASAFRHAPFRSGRWASWPSGSLLPLFGMRRSAPPRRRSEDRRSTTTRQLFHFKTLIPTC